MLTPPVLYIFTRQATVGDPSCRVQEERRGDPNLKRFGCKPLLKTAPEAVFSVQST